MNPILMALILLGLWGAFAISATRRYKLLRVGQPTWETRFDDIAGRLNAVVRFAIVQKKMPYYALAAAGHYLIFFGFVVLLLRTLVLWGRGFDPAFNLWVLGPEPVLGIPLGAVYGFVKDVFALLVLCGVAVFLYLRLIRRERRMTLSGEGIVILGIIASMMIADLSYDGASLVLAYRKLSECGSADYCQRLSEIVAPLAAGSEPAFQAAEPGGSLVSLALAGLSSEALIVIATLGFWIHSTLVLVFLNILPYSKHFHIITAVPNIFFGDRTPRGRLKPLAPSTEALMAQVEKATEGEDLHGARIGYGRIEHFPWKDLLDLYTCTECGRCSDNCPATITGKKLSPKHFTLDLRNNLYARSKELIAGERKPDDLVPNVIDPDVLWACTSCRACEEQCPVNITYVDKIVQMRRQLVVLRGEFPRELAKPFEGMEVNGNPWNLSRSDRATWTEGLEIATFAQKPSTPVLFWVGCAASYDDRAKRIARSTAKLLKKAGVDFAILGDEETCTGDPARRAGNEYLFSMLAETNAATLNAYSEQGGIKTILTTCPHCFNTLTNEYPDFGARFEVVHHTDYLLGLLAQKKLVPTRPVRGKVAFHDSCYLGRYNGIYESPREILQRIEGVELVEVDHYKKAKGLCCGAGGAQMWMEEQNSDRVNVKRTLQLLDTGATKLATACPFCMTMISDGIKSQSKEESITNYDVIELLALACNVDGQDAKGVVPEAPAAEVRA